MLNNKLLSDDGHSTRVPKLRRNEIKHNEQFCCMASSSYFHRQCCFLMSASAHIACRTRTCHLWKSQSRTMMRQRNEGNSNGPIVEDLDSVGQKYSTGVALRLNCFCNYQHPLLRSATPPFVYWTHCENHVFIQAQTHRDIFSQLPSAPLSRSTPPQSQPAKSIIVRYHHFCLIYLVYIPY